MNHKLLLSIIAASIASASLNTSADTLFRPRASLGYSSYELTLTDPGDTLSESSYLKGGIGVTIATGQLYFDLGFSNSLGATYDEGVTPGEDFNRSDTTLTIGYVFSNNMTLFGGYKSGSSEFNNSSTSVSSTKFDASGPYLGLGIGFPSSGGTWSFNAAIAALSAELTDNDTGIPFNASADAVGFGLGAGYSMPFGSTQGLSFKANFQSYDYTDWEDPNYIPPDIQESIFAMDVEYYYNF